VSGSGPETEFQTETLPVTATVGHDIPMNINAASMNFDPLKNGAPH